MAARLLAGTAAADVLLGPNNYITNHMIIYIDYGIFIELSSAVY